MGGRQLREVALSAAHLHDAPPAQLLQRWLPFPVRDAQALLGRVDVMLQKGEQCQEGALAARQRKLVLLVVNANADRPALGVVGQREEHVLLPAVTNQEASQGSVLQHAVGVLHSQRAPVKAAALEFGRSISDGVTVLSRGEGTKVSQVD